MTRNAKILLTVGLVLIVLCAIGMVVQLSAYNEYAGDKPFSFTSNGPVNGANGGFMQSIVAWNHSDQAKAKQAMDMFVFMVIGCAIGVFFVWRSLRPAKPEPEEEEPVHVPSARRRNSTRTTWK
ncbi:MAG: hypothetical protein HDQ87_11790 [Clostridia bacterium]|nr:hypothetical protein [Clostridia bacterium]